MKKTTLIAAFLTFLAVPAVAETIAAPTVTAPVAPEVKAPVAPTIAPTVAPAASPTTELTAAQQAKVAERVAIIKKQLLDLSPAEQSAVLRQSRPDKPKLTDAQKDALRHKHYAMAAQKWGAKSAEDKADLRENATKRWNDLTDSEKTYKRDRLAEQLKAIPAADRQLIIDAAK